MGLFLRKRMENRASVGCSGPSSVCFLMSFPKRTFCHFRLMQDTRSVLLFFYKIA
jgi:hypothetical protein